MFASMLYIEFSNIVLSDSCLYSLDLMQDIGCEVPLWDYVSVLFSVADQQQRAFFCLLRSICEGFSVSLSS